VDLEGTFGYRNEGGWDGQQVNRNILEGVPDFFGSRVQINPRFVFRDGEDL